MLLYNNESSKLLISCMITDPAQEECRLQLEEPAKGQDKEQASIIEQNKDKEAIGWKK